VKVADAFSVQSGTWSLCDDVLFRLARPVALKKASRDVVVYDAERA
jgi:hypothetical protein